MRNYDQWKTRSDRDDDRSYQQENEETQQPRNVLAMNKVWVLVISHRHGYDVSVYATDQAAYAALEDYCVTWWDDDVCGINDIPMPENGEELVAKYFEHVEDESWSLDLRDIHGVKRDV